MELPNKEYMQNDSAMAIIQASAFYEHYLGPRFIHTSSNSSLDDIYEVSEPSKRVNQGLESPEKAPGFAKKFTMSNSSSVSSPSSTNSNGLGYQATAYNLSEEDHSVISFKPEFGNFIHASRSSLLRFEQTERLPKHLYPKVIGEDDEYPMWEASTHYQSQMDLKCTTTSTNHGPPETSSIHRAAATEYGSPRREAELVWLNDQEADTITNGVQETGRQEAGNNKRPSTGESEQALKKQCVITPSRAAKKAKSKPASTSKDPQSVAAKNRRERISERLKILQELVPNGSKVDLVTMLEKAISYVKFLQLQVKVLATDEFWPAQGGKAPDLSQVREAIDAILASQRDRNSSSK